MNTSSRSLATLVVLVAFFILLPAAHSQNLSPAPGKIINSLTPAPGYFTEPGIAVNPRNPQQVVAVFQDNAHASYSVNGGRDWQPASGVEPPNYRVSGDVSVTYDAQGHVFFLMIRRQPRSTLFPYTALNFLQT